MTVKTNARGGGFPPDEASRRAFVKHIIYEFDMVMNTTMYLFHNSDYSTGLNERDDRGERLSRVERWQISSYNSVLESWTVHNRALLEFFTPKASPAKGKSPAQAPKSAAPKGVRGYTDTAAAEDFVIGHEAWADQMIDYKPDAEKSETNKRVAHLSYERLKAKKTWGHRYTEETMLLGLRFLTGIDSDVFPTETAKALRANIELFLGGVWMNHPEWIPELRLQGVRQPAPDTLPEK